MTKLDLVLERVRKLSQDEQDAIAAELEFLLDAPTASIVLTPEQEAELDRRLANPDREYISHEELEAHFEAKYGK